MFSFSSQEVRRVKKIQFGVLSPEEIVSARSKRGGVRVRGGVRAAGSGC